MTPRALCNPGTAEGLKLAVHGGMLLGALACCAYNVAAFWYRRETHNAVNAYLYAGLVALEVAHVNHHRESTTDMHG